MQTVSTNTNNKVSKRMFNI